MFIHFKVQITLLQAHILCPTRNVGTHILPLGLGNEMRIHSKSNIYIYLESSQLKATWILNKTKTTKVVCAGQSFVKWIYVYERSQLYLNKNIKYCKSIPGRECANEIN